MHHSSPAGSCILREEIRLIMLAMLWHTLSVKNKADQNVDFKGEISFSRLFPLGFREFI